MSANRVRGLLVSLIIFGASISQANDSVAPGFDLFTTNPGTHYDFLGLFGLGLLDFEGAPLGSFDFGSGPVGVGDADTIVQRLSAATVPTPTIDIEIIALSLQSVSPVDIGNGPEFIIAGLGRRG